MWRCLLSPVYLLLVYSQARVMWHRDCSPQCLTFMLVGQMVWHCVFCLVRQRAVIFTKPSPTISGHTHMSTFQHSTFSALLELLTYPDSITRCKWTAWTHRQSWSSRHTHIPLWRKIIISENTWTSLSNILAKALMVSYRVCDEN